MSTDPSQTLQSIHERLEELGDLPIFSASLNRISAVSSDPDSDAMELSMEVMKDASLSAKLLQLVNSPYYNRGGSKIGAVSQAVLRLGFDAIKNACLTLKLLDGFSKGNSGFDLNNMLVHAYLSAAFTREMALKTGIGDVEQSYMCGLLNNIGEVIVAYTLPEKYLEITQAVEEGSAAWLDAQQRVFGTSFGTVGLELAKEWGFPSSIVLSIGGSDSDEIKSGRGKDRFNQAMAFYANQLMGALYFKHKRTNKSFDELLGQIAEVAGVRYDDVNGALTKSFHLGCDLAKEFSLDRKLLAPKVIDSGDTVRDKVAKQFSYYAQSIEAPGTTVVEEGSANSVIEKVGNSEVLIKVLGELTVMITEKSDLNSIFMKMMEGIREGAGFYRVALCLLSAQRDRYTARVAMGPDAELLKGYFLFPVKPDKDLFSQVILGGKDCFVEDVTEARWRAVIDENFSKRTGANSFCLAAFGTEQKPLGMVYADMGTSGKPIKQEQYTNFLQLVSHARLALRVR